MTRGTKTEYSGPTSEQRKTQTKQSLRPITITKENKFMETFLYLRLTIPSVGGGNTDVWKVV